MSLSSIILAFFVSLVLGVSIVACAYMRTGLRSRRRTVPVGLAGGVLAGFASQLAYKRSSSNSFFDFGSLPFEYICLAFFQAVLFVFFAGATIHALKAWPGLLKRKADIVSLSVAFGLGFGAYTSASWIWLSTGISWPPGLLIYAATNVPIQICCALLVADTVMDNKPHCGFKQSLRGNSGALLALTSEMVFQFISLFSLDVGHWFAWFRAEILGIMWLGFILLFWLTGFFYLIAHKKADLPLAWLNLKRKESVFYRPWIWISLGVLVVGPSLAIMAMSFIFQTDVSMARIMLFTLLTAPFLAGAVLLSTGLVFLRSRDEDQTTS